MRTSEPLHVAFVWHMHQPYYRSARSGVFEMPWARMHALKDYLDMVEILAGYPNIHQTFNLVPSLIEQLECYASGDFIDTYWEHTLKPAVDLTPRERVFIVERMCEHPDHPRAWSHPRYLELAHKREAHASQGWEACATAFTADELRDLQVWFNLAWFDPQNLATEPLASLVAQGQGFSEEDKRIIGHIQADILAQTLPAYRDAAARGQIEISTSPYFHPILPLLANSDSARISAPDTVVPPQRFAHPEDAFEQICSAMEKHEHAFGKRPQGMWCSEQAVGEDVIPLLTRAGLHWTISDEAVLARSLSGAAAPIDAFDRDGRGTGAPSGPLDPRTLYTSYRLERETGELAIIFRDHVLSDLIGFAYQSWDSRDAAADLLHRLHEIRSVLVSSPTSAKTGTTHTTAPSRPADRAPQLPLVTIALDGENAWEYYPGDGRDFLHYLYDGLNTDPLLRCVTVSEHLREAPPKRSLGWLHTGSWIGGNLRTWSGDRAHNVAWDFLHRARDVAAARRRTATAPSSSVLPDLCSEPSKRTITSRADDAWRHILIAEGSDWFWWFGDHHHTELDHVWDLAFRERLQEVYRLLDEPVPTILLFPIVDYELSVRGFPPRGEISPSIDGLLADASEWQDAGLLAPDFLSTMQRAAETKIREVRFGWHKDRLCLLVVPDSPKRLKGLEIELRLTRQGHKNDPIVRMILEEEGKVRVSCIQWTQSVEVSGAGFGEARTLEAKTAGTGSIEATWQNVLEVSLPLSVRQTGEGGHIGLVVRIGRDGMTEHVFHSAGLTSTEQQGQ